MFKSKSSPATAEGTPAVPHGDASVAGRLTGTPTVVQSAATPQGVGTTTASPAAPAATGPAPAAPATPATKPSAGGPNGPTRPGTTTSPEHGPGVVKRTTNNFKRALLIVVGALAALFAVFNSQNVQVHWIFGDAVNTPLILVIAIAFVAGGIIGWIAAKLGGRKGTTTTGS